MWNLIEYGLGFIMLAAKGQVLGERFRLVDAIGGDAVFSRWLAQDLVLDGETVEIAFMPPEVASSGRAQAGIRDAVAATMALLHTNIATARAYVDDPWSPFFVFDHVEGRPLDACLDEWGPLAEDEAKALLEPLASALDFAHAQGLPHGDLRPSNIVVSEEAVPWLIGFGVAAGMRDAVARMRGADAAGPVCWMSPEQLMGTAPTPAQDIYSLAAIAYECLSGHPPFHRGRVEFQIVNAEPEPLEPETPFTRAILRALSKDPALRPKSCAELLAGDLEKIVMPEVVAAVPVKVPATRRPAASAPPAFPQRPVATPPSPPVPPYGFRPPSTSSHPANPPSRVELPGMPPHQRPKPPPPPPRRAPTPEEIEERRRRLARIEARRTRHREAEKRRDIADATYLVHQDAASTRKAAWALVAVAVVAAAAVAAILIGGRGNIELANAPTRSYSVRDLGRYASFHDIEFGRVIPETPEPGDPIVFGDKTNHVGNVSMDGRLFEVELAEPVYMVFPTVRISLTDTDGGRRISALTFERSGEGVTAEKARKVVANIAARVGREYGIDMGDTLTAINNAYFSQRYSDDFIDIRISSVVAPDSTSISFSLESRVIRGMEVVTRR